ncbi:radical SAM protein [Rhizobium leguminosarum]
MSYSAFFLATHWGREHGGINVFNQDLANAVAGELGSTGTCHCLVKGSTPSDLEGKVIVEAREEFDSPEAIANHIQAVLSASNNLQTDVVVVGHDVHTGFLAIESAAHLKALNLPKVRSAVIKHMHYKQYDLQKGLSLEAREAKEARQTELADRADLILAVGPLLADSSYGATGKKPVTMLIPGAPPIEPATENNEPAWQIFMSGRLGEADDRIKNAQLAVAAVATAYRKAKEVNQGGNTRFHKRGCLTLFGAAPEPAEPENLSEYGEHISLDPIPYTGDTGRLFKTLANSHFALMPSWHEGFGLSGWEAICLGVPLICSSHSGLFQFLKAHVWGSDFSVRSEGVTEISLTGDRRFDAESMSKAILGLTADYSRRKHSAMELSSFLKKHYTWSACAKEFASACDWPLAGSDGWRERQAVAKITLQDPDTDDGLIRQAEEIVAKGLVYTEWQRVCTALNILSARGKIEQGTVGLEARAYLDELSQALDTTLEKQHARPSFLRRSGELDVTWRFLAAASSVSGSLLDFVSLVRPNLWRQICGDGFLLREFFFYLCRFSNDFESSGHEVTTKIEEIVRLGRADDDFQTRLARLALKHPALLDVLNQSEFDSQLPRFAAVIAAFQAHRSDFAEIPPENFATFVWLASEDAIQGIYAPDFTLDFIREALGSGSIPRRWRGDKRFPVAAMLGALPVDKALAILKAFSNDEDETVRWACLDVAFSRSFRSRVEATVRNGSLSAGKSLTMRLGEIIDTAVSYDGSHPWLQREFLSLYHDEAQDGRSCDPAPFTLSDFPRSRELLGVSFFRAAGAGPTQLHPEVEAVRKVTAEDVRRILLVLPPIEIAGSAERKNASRTTTPPLGLGLIASALSRAGHFVEIADCHRFPALTEKLADRAGEFDWVGLNVVLSTVKSTQQIVADIKARSPEVMIAIGGPAANLGVWQTSVSVTGRNDWDFVVRGNAEQNFVDLVALTGRAGAWPEIVDVLANPNNQRLLDTHCEKWHFQKDLRPADKSLPDVWEPEAMLDRRVFRGPNGAYEPAPTRKKNRTYKEAHVVMSRGCEWKCTFCTERKSLSGGERRRSTRSVLRELMELAQEHSDLRIQFIDDNLLPQIAARSTDSELAAMQDLKWAKDFLAGLVMVRERATGGFGWRGIFRFEDFVQYEKQIPDFIDLLVQSGCSMLAFGIEHGNEAQRKKLKANTTSTALGNDDICALISRLKAAGIRTKGYFILGGQYDSVDNAKETIAFALKSGVSLAYFAIYKDFVEAASKLRSSSLIGRKEVEAFLSYKQLSQDLDGIFLPVVPSSDPSLTESSDSRPAIYRDLQQLGFSFADIVKYNDYHSDEGPAAPLMERNAFGDKDVYFETLKDAYLSFYLRKDFVSEYEGLVANGY